MARPPREDQAWFARWLARNMPSREQLAESRWLGRFGQRALHSEFWRFTRRSVPRGVAVGLFVGVFFLIPGVQIIAATIFSIPWRANIPIAAAMTFLTNPFTTPFVMLAAIGVGNLLGFHADRAAVIEMYTRQAPVSEWIAWLASDAAPALVTGLFVIGVASGAIGYFLSVFVWRWWTARKWRRRQALRVAAPD
jgi:uncharacterized protein